MAVSAGTLPNDPPFSGQGLRFKRTLSLEQRCWPQAEKNVVGSGHRLRSQGKDKMHCHHSTMSSFPPQQWRLNRAPSPNTWPPPSLRKELACESFGHTSLVCGQAGGCTHPISRKEMKEGLPMFCYKAELTQHQAGKESHTVLRLALGLSIGNQRADSSEHRLFLAEALIYNQKTKGRDRLSNLLCQQGRKAEGSVTSEGSALKPGGGWRREETKGRPLRRGHRAASPHQPRSCVQGSAGSQAWQNHWWKEKGSSLGPSATCLYLLPKSPFLL